MTCTNDHRTPAQLTAKARAAFRAIIEQYALAGFLPVTANYTLDFNFDVNQTALPQAASFRSFNTESDVGSTSGGNAWLKYDRRYIQSSSAEATSGTTDQMADVTARATQARKNWRHIGQTSCRDRSVLPIRHANRQKC